jgi:hypothetical protein
MQMTPQISGTLAGLAFSISTTECKTGTITRVEVQGDYWANGTEGGSFLEMIISAALAAPWAPVPAMLCDLSKLIYTGGDRLLIWRHLLDKQTRPPLRYALLASAHNFAHIASLIDYEDDDALRSLLFSDEADALQFLCDPTVKT